MVKASWSAVNFVAAMLLNRTEATSEHRAADCSVYELSKDSFVLRLHNVFDKGWSFQSSFLVQNFKETLQYCDEWRKFTSVSESVSESVSQSVIV